MELDITLYHEMLKGIAQEPRSLQELMLDYPELWNWRNWDEKQVSLFLACCPEIEKVRGEQEQELYKVSRKNSESLVEEILKVIRQTGRPLSASQVRGKLSEGMQATQEQILAAVQKHDRLERFGPGLIRERKRN